MQQGDYPPPAMPKLERVEPETVALRLSPQQVGLIDRLVKQGLLGTSRPEICKRWVIDALKEIYPEEFRGGPG